MHLLPVVREVELRDRFVEHESLDQDADEVVVDQVARQAQVDEALRGAQAVREDLRVAHLHSKQAALVLDAYMLRPVRQRQVRQVLQVLEHDPHV